MKKKKDEEKYVITLKGLIALSINKMGINGADAISDQIIESLELYLRRHHMKKPGQYGAIVFNGKSFEFTYVKAVK